MANLNSYFFEPIEGFADLQCGTDSAGESDCEGKPAKAKEMTGLKVVDDHTFTIKTTDKVSNLPVRLGYTAFAPLPDSFFSDPKAYGEKPIGAGPFKLDSKTDTEMVVSKFADYSGANKPNVDKVTFRIYNDDRRPTTTWWRTTSTSPTASRATGSPTTCASSGLPDRNGLSGVRHDRDHDLLVRTTTISRTTPDCARPSRWRSTGI